MKKISAKILSLVNVALVIWAGVAYGQEAPAEGFLTAAKEIATAIKDDSAAKKTVPSKDLAKEAGAAPEATPALETTVAKDDVITKEISPAPEVVSTTEAIDQIEKSLLSSDKSATSKGQKSVVKAKKNKNDDTSKF